MYKFLTPEIRAELLLELKSEKYKKHADRIRVILLLDDDWLYKNISAAYFLDEGTIRNWRKRFIEGGLERLMNDQYKAKSSMLSPSQLKKLEKHLEQNIYQRTKDIVAYVASEFGIEYKESSIRRILKSLGFSYKKAKKVPSRADKEKQLRFLNSYRGFKSHGPVYFMDSTHPKYCPVTAYGWIKKGTDKFLETNSGKVHLNITGAVNIKNLDVITRQSDVVNQNSICEILKAVRAKNPGEHKIYMVMDNASYNKSKKVRRLAKKLNIRLKYVPPYSPNLNLIERLWRFFRDKVLAMRHYETLDIFSKTCSNFFRSIRKYKDELETLLVDNFQILGT